MIEKETVDLTADGKCLLRTALDNEIERLLRFHKEWTPWIEAAFAMYQRLGGYFTKQNFESYAGLKKQRSLFLKMPRLNPQRWIRFCLTGRL